MSERQPIQEATLTTTENETVATSEGWFVLNLAHAPARGNAHSGAFIELEGEQQQWAVGVNVHVLEPGQQACRYHEESAQEGFLVLQGECLLIVEEHERRLRQWDYFHCPDGTRHVFVGAGAGPCAILMLGARKDELRIHYPVSEAAGRHGASVEAATDHPREAYADWPGPWEPVILDWPLD
jgi:uncharacterized cupin superfamily protein